MATTAETLRVRVNEHFTLTAGKVPSTFDKRRGCTVYTVGRPKTPMIAQLLAYLKDLPDTTDVIGTQARYLGVGLAALAVRWRSYLATVMDPATPFHETIPTDSQGRQPGSFSYLGQTEMKRLHIEISYNLAATGPVVSRVPLSFLLPSQESIWSLAFSREHGQA